MSRELADHLQYFSEIGVDGVSRDPQWRRRGNSPPKGGRHLQQEVSQVASGQVASGQVASGQVASGQVASGQVASGQVASGQVASGQVASGFSRIVPVPTESLDDIKIEIGPDCRRCKLCTLGRSQVVFGVGTPKARLMFVGEAPGEDEDRKGEPFVGRAGQLLTRIIEAIGFTREQVYIANVIKCRPPSNRNPEPDEVASCEPFLFRQIDAIQPKVIVPLGKFAAQSLLKSMDPITRLRGRQFEYRGAVLIPTFHPAYLLRNPSAKREVWEDMKKVRAILQSEA